MTATGLCCAAGPNRSRSSTGSPAVAPSGWLAAARGEHRCLLVVGETLGLDRPDPGAYRRAAGRRPRCRCDCPGEDTPGLGLGRSSRPIAACWLGLPLLKRTDPRDTVRTGMTGEGYSPAQSAHRGRTETPVSSGVRRNRGGSGKRPLVGATTTSATRTPLELRRTAILALHNYVKRSALRSRRATRKSCEPGRKTPRASCGRLIGTVGGVDLDRYSDAAPSDPSWTTQRSRPMRPCGRSRGLRARAFRSVRPSQ